MRQPQAASPDCLAVARQHPVLQGHQSGQDAGCERIRPCRDADEAQEETGAKVAALEPVRPHKHHQVHGRAVGQERRPRCHEARRHGHDAQGVGGKTSVQLPRYGLRKAQLAGGRRYGEQDACRSVDESFGEDVLEQVQWQCMDEEVRVGPEGVERRILPCLQAGAVEEPVQRLPVVVGLVAVEDNGEECCCDVYEEQEQATEHCVDGTCPSRRGNADAPIFNSSIPADPHTNTPIHANYIPLGHSIHTGYTPFVQL